MKWSKKKTEKSADITGLESPEVGSRWIKKDENGSPWGESYTDFEEIFDVKDGWVRFGRMPNGKFPQSSLFRRDARLQLSYFLNLYQKFIPLPFEPEKPKEVTNEKF